MLKSHHVEIYHWLLSLDQPGETQAAMEILSDSEKQHLEKIISPDHKVAFLTARSNLRRILGQRTNQPASALQFQTGPHGKPKISDPSVHFNLSHSGGVAALAISSTISVGVDIEKIRPVKKEIARRFFTSNEADQIEKAEGLELKKLFLKCWTQKEAVLKANGMGLQGGLDSFQVALDDGKPRVLAMDNVVDPEKQWTLETFELYGDVIGALAVPLGEIELKLSFKNWQR